MEKGDGSSSARDERVAVDGEEAADGIVSSGDAMLVERAGVRRADRPVVVSPALICGVVSMLGESGGSDDGDMRGDADVPAPPSPPTCRWGEASIGDRAGEANRTGPGVAAAPVAFFGVRLLGWYVSEGVLVPAVPVELLPASAARPAASFSFFNRRTSASVGSSCCRVYHLSRYSLARLIMPSARCVTK